MKSIEELIQGHLRTLEAYTPGVQPTGKGWIKLNTNELPFSPPDSVQQAIQEELGLLARYPNPRSEQLREVLADFHGFKLNQVIVGNGSDDLLNLLARSFGGAGRKTLETFPSYSLYPVITAIAGGTIHSIEFNENFELPIEALLSAGADLLFLTCPNAPTGIRFPQSDLNRLASEHEGILVIDEAYAEFSGESAMKLVHQHENVVITRTFSKAYGLAGLRVGYAIASAAVISVLDRVRDSYNVNRLSQAGAVAAVKSRGFYDACILEICETRERVRETLAELGWKIYPSKANFLFGAPVNSSGAGGPEIASSLFKHLEDHRILVRYFPKHPLTASYLRISIGSNSEMDQFLEEVRTWTRSA
ncbi:histidinol-phosphate transaminase [Puniceicoccales bacterium CK1056]|uniref:Histidinol-phosphate aminotransferase n=1 Tax=Oceanipulchritudo coccoides TaxID=2706888 RepID=A0A6B2M112_9BACT|nr:histidinol-phosphate transaminase [Oceanipulchritudo coccoides]NDV62671.1 histidinol-phosphate transaminase [Oceanipulchritudo coccoides]